MRLARLSVIGFKSFADRTEFTFDAPVTGIVGPNGCGKSNVVDAIKWVLGERSAKSLRSKEMADVIFAGSAGRKPLGMAGVTLTFDNPMLEADGMDPAHVNGSQANGRAPGALDAEEPQDDPVVDEEDEASAPAFERPAVRRRALPVDTETVDVERRLYRDGTSEYLINGRKARLRDIRDLFLDTGVGADAYSIIEQGRVDAMLVASPVERRTIFEEAAGVARFKARRLEAQRRLERTEMNLVAAREQLAATERRLRQVRGQAAKARRFRELDIRHTGLRMALVFDQHHDLCTRLDGLTSRLQELEVSRREAGSALAALEEGKQQAELRRHDLLSQQRDLEAAQAAAEHAAQTAEQRRQMTDRALQEARRQIEHEESLLREIVQRVDRLDAAIASQMDSIERLEQALGAAENALRSATDQRAGLQDRAAEHRAAVGERRAAAACIDRDRAALLARMEAEQRRATTLGEEAGRIGGQADALRSDRAAALGRRSQCREGVERRCGAIELLEQRLAAAARSAALLTGDQRALAESLSRLEQRRVALDSRRATLREMVETRAGFGDAVKAVLDRRARAGEGNPFAGVIAPLADLIDADTEHAPAVEAALGASLQAIVVGSLSDVLDGGALRELPGRVAFLPAAPLPDAPHREPASMPLDLPPARALPLGGLVRCDPRVRDAVNRLLGDAFLVDDLESAVLLRAASHGPRTPRFITRTGEVLEPDGRIVAGPMNGAGDVASGLLQRAAELASLQGQIAPIDAEITDARASLANVDQQAAALDEALGRFRHDLAAEQRALVADQAAEDRLSADLARTDREVARLEEHLESVIQRSAALAREQAEIAERADRLGRLHTEQVELASEAENAIHVIQRELEAASDRLTALKVETGQHGEKLASAQRELRRLHGESEQAGQDRERTLARIEHTRSRVTEHEQALAEAADQIERARADAAAAGERLQAIRGELKDAEAGARALGEQVGSARERARIVERDWHSLEVARREVEVKRETIEQRAAEDLGLDLAAERAAYAELMRDTAVRPIDAAAVLIEADDLRAEIKRLGNVNLDAIEEEANLEGRNEELVRQVADIDSARATLEDLITRLSDASRDRFRRTFEAIQAHFGGDNGMFRRLFGGGKADIRLIPNAETGEIDWLESGVEVMAKPPGKEPRTINLLSGGEKTLTAIALLLAIFKSKPSPFCVLDEVDAALDDANVARFCATMRQFTEQCHMIVITHHKRTMQAADQLYGVTMQERGVSTRVSVRIEQVGEKGHIRVAGPEGADRSARRPEAPAAAPHAHNGHVEIKPAAAEDAPTLRERLAQMRSAEAATA